MPKLNQSKYMCKICGKTSEQKSHHDTHLASEAHKKECKIFKLECEKLSIEEVKAKYPGYDSCQDDNSLIDKLIENLSCVKVEMVPETEPVNRKKPENNTLWNLADNVDDNSAFNEIKTKVDSVVKQGHQILYNNSVVGMKAMNDIMRIFTLKLIADMFEDEESDIYQTLLSILTLSNLSQPQIHKYLGYCKDLRKLCESERVFMEWKNFNNRILCKLLPGIYSENDGTFNCEDEGVICQLIDMIYGLEITQEFKDAYATTCGDIHESFRAYGGKQGAKELGQFFTPRKLINLVFHAFGLKAMLEEFESPIIFDPCMGTAGFLTRVFNLCDNVHSQNVRGCETEEDTIKFAYASSIITTKNTDCVLEKCNSLSESNSLLKKVHFIATNPPFGTKFDYCKTKKVKKGEKEKYEKKFIVNENDDEETKAKKMELSPEQVKFTDIYPIKTNNGACLFTQMCVYKLAENGVCCIVLPDGELFEGGKLNSWNQRFRKWLCESVNILHILKVAGGTFEHAGVKTCVVIFKKNGPTQNIQWSETTKECNEVKSIFSTSFEDLKNTNFSLDMGEYTEEKEENFEVPMVRLGDVCEFYPKSKRTAKYGEKKGKYPFFRSSMKVNSFVDEADFNEEAIIIGDGGQANINIGIKFSTSNHCYVFKTIDKRISNRYIYLFILYNLDIFDKLFKGSGLKNISKSNIEKLKIPLPSLEIQQEIVDKLTLVEAGIAQSQTQIQQLKLQKDLFKEHSMKGKIKKLLEGSEVKMLGEVCEIKSGNHSTKKSDFINGDYLIIGGGMKPIGIHNKYNCDENTILCASHGTVGHISIYPNKTFITMAFSITENIKILKKMYIYNYLKSLENIIKSLGKGTALKCISMSKLKQLKIPIPSPEIQQKVIAIYEQKEQELALLDAKSEAEQAHIESLKKLAKDVIHDYCGGYDEEDVEDEYEIVEVADTLSSEPNPDLSPSPAQIESLDDDDDDNDHSSDSGAHLEIVETDSQEEEQVDEQEQEEEEEEEEEEDEEEDEEEEEEEPTIIEKLNKLLTNSVKSDDKLTVKRFAELVKSEAILETEDDASPLKDLKKLFRQELKDTGSTQTDINHKEQVLYRLNTMPNVHYYKKDNKTTWLIK